MQLNKGTVVKLLGKIGTGDDEGALALARYTFKRGTPMEEIIAALAEQVEPEFMELMVEATPWLGQELFDSAPSSGASDGGARDKILEYVGEAVDQGAKLSDMRVRFFNKAAFDSAIAALEAEGAIIGAMRPTAGRPARHYFLPAYAPSADEATASTTPTKPEATRESLLAFLNLHKHRGLTGAQAKARFSGDPVAILDALVGEQAIAWLNEATGGRPVKRYVALGGMGRVWLEGELAINLDPWDNPDMIKHYFGRIERGDAVPDHALPMLEREAESQRTYGA